MSTHPYLDHGLSILHARLKAPLARPAPSSNNPPSPFLTISRETCAGATSLGHHLVPLLDEQVGEAGRSWMFFDNDLITQALTRYHLPERLAAYLPEDRLSETQSLIGELVGLHPSLWELEHKISDAIVQLAQLGCVILTGRGSNVLTRHIPGGFHLRLVASVDERIRRYMELQRCGADTARQALSDSDRAKQRYVQANFQQDPTDPHGYDLVINTDHLSTEQAAQLVLQVMRSRVPHPT